MIGCVLCNYASQSCLCTSGASKDEQNQNNLGYLATISQGLILGGAGSTSKEGKILNQFKSAAKIRMSDLGQNSTKILCQSKCNTAPSLGIEQTEASTDKAVSVFTHASSVVTHALTTTAGSETHHQHQDAGAFTRRQYASVGRGSGDSADSPRRRGSK